MYIILCRAADKDVGAFSKSLQMVCLYFERIQHTLQHVGWQKQLPLCVWAPLPNHRLGDPEDYCIL
jgi:hypothetical protein